MVLASTKEASAGVIFIDKKGQVGLSICRRLPKCNSPEEAELSSIICGLSKVSKVYISWLCVETDCSEVAALLNPSVVNQSAPYPLVDYERV